MGQVTSAAHERHAGGCGRPDLGVGTGRRTGAQGRADRRRICRGRRGNASFRASVGAFAARPRELAPALLTQRPRGSRVRPWQQGPRVMVPENRCAERVTSSRRSASQGAGSLAVTVLTVLVGGPADPPTPAGRPVRPRSTTASTGGPRPARWARRGATPTSRPGSDGAHLVDRGTDRAPAARADRRTVRHARHPARPARRHPRRRHPPGPPSPRPPPPPGEGTPTPTPTPDAPTRRPRRRRHAPDRPAHPDPRAHRAARPTPPVTPGVPPPTAPGRCPAHHRPPEPGEPR